MLLDQLKQSSEQKWDSREINTLLGQVLKSLIMKTF